MGQSTRERRAQASQKSLLDSHYVKRVLEEEGLFKTIHLDKINRYVIQKRVRHIREVPDLPKGAYDILERKCCILSSKLLDSRTSGDGSTTKLLIELCDGLQIESVIMRYGAVELQSFPTHLQKRDNGGLVEFKSGARATLCVSSQVGCAMGCSFCATGTMGHIANLTSGEILEQLVHANKIEPIRNVVFMGMGEPLDNYSEVLAAIEGMTDVRRFGIAHHRISLSTVGVAPRIRSLAKDAPFISLAFSLHAPNDNLRVQLLPSATAFPLRKIFAALDYFVEQKNKMVKGQFVLIQYCLMEDMNSSEEIATEVGRLLQSRKNYVMLNVIPYNPTDVDSSVKRFRTPTQSTVDTFVDTVRKHGIRTTIRQELGQDIGGACGQLVCQSSPHPSYIPDVEDAVWGKCDRKHADRHTAVDVVNRDVGMQDFFVCRRWRNLSPSLSFLATAVVLLFLSTTRAKSP